MMLLGTPLSHLHKKLNSDIFDEDEQRINYDTFDEDKYILPMMLNSATWIKHSEREVGGT